MLEQIARNKRRTVVYVILFFVMWVGIGAVVGAIASPTNAATGIRSSGGVFGGMVIAGLFALVGILFSLTSGQRLVLAISGAHPADPQQYRELHNIVEALAIGDGLPKPEVYVIEDPSPNAFATGTSPKKAAITATTGLLEIMNREELEGVLGHEMSHIKNYDVRLILIVSTLIGMAGLLASLVWRIAFFSRPRGKDGGQILLILYAAGILLALVAFIFGPLIKLALSRRRESLADASGVELTRNPAGLISALRKLKADETPPLRKINHATASMYIEDPLQQHESWFHSLFSTHPPLEQRIAALEAIQQGRSA